jgi:predicted DNA-binding transcriptional regulator AlpA
MKPDHLLMEVHAAEFLKLSPRTLQAWRAAGHGPAFVRVGRSIRYRHSDLVAWIESNIVRQPSANGGERVAT